MGIATKLASGVLRLNASKSESVLRGSVILLVYHTTGDKYNYNTAPLYAYVNRLNEMVIGRPQCVLC